METYDVFHCVNFAERRGKVVIDSRDEGYARNSRDGATHCSSILLESAKVIR